MSTTPPLASEDLEKAHETLRLNGLIRSGCALAVLVLAYSMDWMDFFAVGTDFSDVTAKHTSMSESAGGRQSYVIKPGDMEVFGIPLTYGFLGLLLAAILRAAYPHGRRLHPFFPLALGAAGTIMLATVLGYAVHDETAKFMTTGFYIALAAVALNTIFDCLDVMDWRALRRGAAQ